jgi:hypothetical protein
MGHVKELCLVVPVGSSCTVQGLAVLAAMRQLHNLTLELADSSNYSLQDAVMQLLLSAVRHVRHVCIRVQERHVEDVRDVVHCAERELFAQGLQLAAEPVVAAIKE